MKPTGRLHLGNYLGALKTLVELQEKHELYCFVADWHALTTSELTADELVQNTREVAIDYLAAGIDAKRAVVFVQSEVKQHAELYLLLSMVTPHSWLTRVPTYKDLIATKRIESPSHGLVGYPVLQAADILMYRARAVPVGRDQVPHLEIAREIARRFEKLHGGVFVEPEAILAEHAVLPGLDGRKMSKSYGNVIYLADSEEETATKIMGAFTTPSKVRATDPGYPEGCVVCQWRRALDPQGYRASWDEDRRGMRGCVENKRELIDVVNGALAAIRARRRELSRDPAVVDAILHEGAERAREEAERTMIDVRRVVGVR